jgi:acetyl-CoA C-acetyltransferase
MRYAGGPFNNFVLHATAQLALALRETGRTGLISSVSGVLTKQAFSVWSAAPPQDQFQSIDVSEAVLSACPPRQLADGYAGVASIAGYTVLASRRDHPSRAIALAETPDGRRVIVSSVSDRVAQAMTDEEFCGRRVFVAGDGTFDVAESRAAMGER